MNKYGAIKIEIDGIIFDSRKESRRYSELRLLEKAGVIKDLKCQPKIDITVNHKHICNYIADFQYINEWGELVIEDVKGMKTPVYRLKKKLVEAIYGFSISEVQ